MCVCVCVCVCVCACACVGRRGEQMYMYRERGTKYMYVCGDEEVYVRVCTGIEGTISCVGKEGMVHGYGER